MFASGSQAISPVVTIAYGLMLVALFLTRTGIHYTPFFGSWAVTFLIALSGSFSNSATVTPVPRPLSSGCRVMGRLRYAWRLYFYTCISDLAKAGTDRWKSCPDPRRGESRAAQTMRGRRSGSLLSRIKFGVRIVRISVTRTSHRWSIAGLGIATYHGHTRSVRCDSMRELEFSRPFGRP